MRRTTTVQDDDADGGGDEFDENEPDEEPSFNNGKGKTQRAARRLRDEIADDAEMQTDFAMTYKPSRHEEGWLVSSLAPFYQQNLLADVLACVKGGKEATVYRCKASPALSAQTGAPFVAAKVYRPQQFRSLRNDKMYREGRAVLTAEGRAVKNSDHRILRALGKKTDFGRQVQHTSWLMHEYTTLERLFRAGGAVPQSVAASENALLMGYVGDEHQAAPTLSEITLEQNEAESLYASVLRNIELLLRLGLVHGDLSAYNLLYWDHAVVLIDFPQVTSVEANPHARFLLERDLARVCDYFSRQGARGCDADLLANKLWRR